MPIPVQIAKPYVSGIDARTRAMLWLGSELEQAVQIYGKTYAQVKQAGAEKDISTAVTLASVSVPAAPRGYQVMVEAVATWDWTTASVASMNAFLKLETGTAVIASAHCYVVATAGSYCGRLTASRTQQSNATYQLTLENNTAQSAVYLRNTAIVARYWKES